jgi:nucleoside-diphosphate-sugar epimerase
MAGQIRKTKTEKHKIVMVTGGAGYVGSLLIRKLLQHGYRVVCVDTLRFGGSSLIDVWENPDFEFNRVDITDYKNFDDVLRSRKYFAVVHLAAIVGDPACKREPELATKTNRDASIRLLEKAVELGIERFVFASTCSNYGKMKDVDGCVDETSPLSPVSLYAQLKVEFENELLHKIRKTAKFSPTALRFSTVYGISPRMRFDLTVNEFTKQLALGRELLVFGENFWRPYCHVIDFSNAILAVLSVPKDKVAYNVFNVGNNEQNYTKKMIVDELLRVIPDGQVQYVHKQEDPRDYRVNFNKIKNELGFKITKTVPEGIQGILRSIKMGIIENPDDQRYYNIPV